jgi:hypothetical protein
MGPPQKLRQFYIYIKLFQQSGEIFKRLRQILQFMPDKLFNTSFL